ncbi:extracellular solute-binding protein [Micromonospora fluostatini]|uniref:extracellular solute-binding protein n=1 Tax=Micromonospora sp. JCM 30529 TaxID=3421643 RepID=UPI003D17FD83
MTGPGRLGRRTLLRAAVAAPVAGLAGCSGGATPVRVVVVWSAEELARFRAVLRGYPAGPVQATSAGDDIDAFLNARRLAGTSPDVAILPRPGLVTAYARRGWLAQVEAAASYRTPTGLADLLSPDGRRHGVWVKAAHKSLFWYLPSRLPTPPATWDELVALARRLGARARAGTGPAPLAVGAADGWVLTDWFENVLADVTDPPEYDALARGTADWQGRPVRAALLRLAELWGLPGAFPGGGRRALLTQFQESVIQVVRRREAVLLYGADFTDSVARTFRHGPEQPATFRFPGARAGVDGPLLVGGDVAVAFAGSTAGVRLVQWLTEVPSFGPWRRSGGYLSPDVSVPPWDYPDSMTQLLATELRQAASPRFDLSDRLPAPFTGSDGIGIWRIMQDFFADVTNAVPPAEAVRRTMVALSGAARDTERAR